jgi:uncharacterized protein
MGNPKPVVAGIFLYPIKSLDPLPVARATILEGGSLQHDREFALFDESGNFVNGKRNSMVHSLRSRFDLDTGELFLSCIGKGASARFLPFQERRSLEGWLSDCLGAPISVRQNPVAGFPDDTTASGPTIVSRATMEEVASWFPGLSVDDVRRRFRPNVEISGVPPFWEDQLFADEGNVINFNICEVRFHGVNPCARCVVPTRDPQTGELYPDFQTRYMTKRRETLPAWSHPSQFDHFYRFAVNTRINHAEAGKVLHVGDSLAIIGSGVV